MWNDLNGNGLQDSGEPGIPGITVNLCADIACATVKATTVTDQNGAYHFHRLYGGTYYVQVASGLPPGYTASPSLAGTDTTVDSNGSPATVILPDAFTDNTIDFGYVPPAQGAIGDFVWHDLSRDGIQDLGEPGINNITVNLLNSQNQVISTTNTVTHSGVDGYYQFIGLAAGTYTVQVGALPPGYTATTSTASGSTTANDSNGSPAVVTLATNLSVNQTIDFGYVTPCAGAIGDYVWNDLNGNGIQDANEPGIPGITVNLYDSTHGFIVSTTTDSIGAYHFMGRCAATYIVEAVATSDYAPTVSSAPGSTPDNDSNGSPATVTLGIDETNNSIDFGFYQKLSVLIRAQCPASNTGEIGVAFTADPIAVSGGVGPFTFSLATGSIPAGLTLDLTTGAVTGIPPEAGSFTIKATDSLNNVATVGCPYTVIPGPVLACSATSSGEVGVLFNSGPMTVTGGTAPFTFSGATDAIPSGLSLDASTGGVTVRRLRRVRLLSR